ncbi:hypothetical protein ACFX19_037359 [Malus domestica]
MLLIVIIERVLFYILLVLKLNQIGCRQSGAMKPDWFGQRTKDGL